MSDKCVKNHLKPVTVLTSLPKLVPGKYLGTSICF